MECGYTHILSAFVRVRPCSSASYFLFGGAAMPIVAQALAGQLKGLLSFPVTPFTPANEIDLPRFREHIQYMAGHHPAGLFVCGGTGEFYSLNLAEYQALVRAAVSASGRAGRTLPALPRDRRGHQPGRHPVPA